MLKVTRDNETAMSDATPQTGCGRCARAEAPQPQQHHRLPRPRSVQHAEVFEAAAASSVRRDLFTASLPKKRTKLQRSAMSAAKINRWPTRSR